MEDTSNPADTSTADTTSTDAPESAESAAAEAVAEMFQVSKEDMDRYQRNSMFHDNLLNDLQNEPRRLLSMLMESNPELSNHFEEMLAERYLAQVAEERLTPEERKMRDIEAELKRYKDAEEEAKRASEEAEREAAREELASTVKQAMTMTGFPIDATLAAWAKRGMELALSRDIVPTPELLSNYMKSKVSGMFGGYVDALEGDALLDALGEKTLDRVRAALKSKTPAPAPVIRPSKKLSGSQKSMNLRDRILGEYRAQPAVSTTTQDRLRKLLRGGEE